MPVFFRCAAFWLLVVFSLVAAKTDFAVAQNAHQTTQITQETSKIAPSQLLVRPKAAPDFLDDPLGWINVKQREFVTRMRTSMQSLSKEKQWAAGWTLILLSFGYGIFHAAGPGHGKAVVSAWLLANEQQLRRGVLIAFMAAIVQAMTAIVLVSAVLLFVAKVGSVAKSMTSWLEAASYGLISLLGIYLIWQAVSAVLASRAPVSIESHGHGHHGHDHAHHHHGHDDAHHHHDHDHDHHGHSHGAECGCGHAHMPDAKSLDGDWSLWKAGSIAFAVGIRPCSGAVLVLLAANAIGIYWAGIVSTIVMAIGTAITVSVIAIAAVSSRKLAFAMAGGDAVWLDWTATGLRFLAGLFIAMVGVVLFWNALANPLAFN